MYQAEPEYDTPWWDFGIDTIYLIAGLWIICIILLLWLGNYLIYNFLNKKLPWIESPGKRFYVQLFSSAIYSLLCINATYYVFKVYFTEVPPDSYQYILLNIYGIIFTLPVISIHFGIFFMTKWKKVVIENESLEKENIKTELTAIKNHIDPHFLFNNLNILSSLIEPHNEAALDFLDNFSEVYRYVLKNKDTELVDLGTELEFMSAYLFIMKKRFDKQMRIEINVENRYKSRLIPPLALQLLIENCLKHNKISYENPLEISIFIEGKSFLVVKNSLQLKDRKKYYTSGSGLANLEKRYQLLSDQKMLVEKTENEFIVKVPLLTLD